MSLSSPTRVSIIKAFVRHCAERHPETALDSAILDAAEAGTTYAATPLL